MAIVEEYERFQDRELSEERNGGARYTTSYVIRCDSRSDGPLVARTSEILPLVGVTQINVTRPHGRPTLVLTCSKLGPGKPIDGENDLVFLFPTEFTLDAPEETDIQPNPLLRRPDVNWTFAETTEVLYRDEDLIPIQSSAGQQYDPPVEMQRPVSVLIYEDNVSDFDPMLAADLTDSINNERISLPVGIHGRRRLFPAFTCWCHHSTAGTGFENGIYFMRRNIEIHVKPLLPDGSSPWLLPVLDQGTYELDDAGTRRIIRLDDGSPTNAPVTLDGDGRAMIGEIVIPSEDPTQPPIVIQTGQAAYYHKHRVNKLRNFNALQLRYP